ncbi:MAG: hypothetical protein Q4D84_09430, partial [Campylobacter sp.]|nr:hypothetical protein [Campylobacter sp.]
VPRNSNFEVSSSDQINDNTGLQKYKDNVITVSVGEKDKEGDIGTLNSTNQAFIQFETTLGDEFNKDEYITYNAKFINKSINLEFDGKINRCEDKRYYLEVAGISNRVVNKHFKELGNSENLFTQLASRAFDTKLLNISTSSSKGRILEKFDLLPTEKVRVDVVSGGNCEKGQNVIDEITGNADNFFLFSKEQLDDKEILDLKGIKIKKAYPALYFRISYLDSNNQLIKKPSCFSDPFSIRPKELKFYNASNGTASFETLVGGQGYRNIWLQAVDNDNQIAQNYSTKVNPINFALSSQRPATCPDANFDFQNETTLEADFNNGRGELKRVIDGVKNLFAPEQGTNFVYPEVGHVLITARDKKWTTIDQAAGATETQSHLHDCIINSDTITENSDGKIGCDISSRNDLNLLFRPNDIVINNLQILNFNNGAMTYLSGNATGMEASANFNITAQLADNARTTARLYTRGCYSRNVAFSTTITGDVPDFTNLNGTAIDDPVARNRAVLQNILYFNQATQDPDDNEKTINTKANATSDNNGAHTLDRRSFLNGIAPYNIRFNFGRDIRFARNPFRITSNNFTFNNIADTDGVA